MMKKLTAHRQYSALFMALVLVGQYFIVNVHAANVSVQLVNSTSMSDQVSDELTITDKTLLNSHHSISEDSSIVDSSIVTPSVVDNTSSQTNHPQQCHMQSAQSIEDVSTTTTSLSSSMKSCCGDDCSMMSCYLATAILDSNYPLIALAISQADGDYYTSIHSQYSSPLYRPPIRI